MNNKIRVGAVSYLNTKPLTFAFEHGAMHKQLNLHFDYPSKLAEQLMNDEIDVGLIPVAAIPLLKEYHIISDYCIGTEGEVASVCLFSEVPIHEIDTILLDYQSRTSVALLKILLNQHWKIAPILQESKVGYEMMISGKTAGLVIGDRALLQRAHSKYIYDLGLEWKAMTGLPFVFAAWVANKQLPPDFLVQFNESIQQSLMTIEDIVGSMNYPAYDLNVYYKHNISYLLDENKRNGLELFLQTINNFH